MRTIGVFGRKGGSGKTMVSHMLAHGMSLHNHTSIMLQTDVRTFRPPEIVDGRNYILATTSNDETDLTKLTRIYEMFGDNKSASLVIDGGANRREMDLLFAPLCDLVLIPTGCSQEDIDTAEADYEELVDDLAANGKNTEVFIILNRWPGLTKKLEMINSRKWVKDFLKRCEKKENLFPFFISDMPSLMDMANGSNPNYTLLINKKAKRLANIVGRKVEIMGGEEFVSPSEESRSDEELDREIEHTENVLARGEARPAA